MRNLYFLLAVASLAGLIPALYAGWMWVAHYPVPFGAFTLPVFADLAVMCFAFHKLESEL